MIVILMNSKVKKNYNKKYNVQFGVFKVVGVQKSSLLKVSPISFQEQSFQGNSLSFHRNNTCSLRLASLPLYIASMQC